MTIVAAFAQAPVLFVLALAAWLALCTALSSLLRYFRSYGAVLAGYIVTLVAFGALDHPKHVFDLAAARLAVVVIGVVSPALVFLLTEPGSGPAALGARVVAGIAGTARLLDAALRGGDVAALVAQRSRVAAGLAALDRAQRLYSAGLSDFVNLLSAERSLYAAGDAATLSELAGVRALVSPCKALGGGWQGVSFGDEVPARGR